MTHQGYPSLDEIYERLDRFVSDRPDIARTESLGLSEENREVRAVTVTDGRIPEEEKDVAVIVCGRHGDELGARVVGPALLDWLASPEGEETRRRQIVIVVPVANPDGCVHEEFGAPKDRLSETEEKTIGALAKARRPDVVVDIHSWGPVDGEAVITANTSRAGEDVFIHEAIARKMAESAAAKGYPFLIHRCSLSGAYNNFYSGMCYESFHSLAFGMEVNHGFLSPEECAESGVAAIQALFEEGNTRSGWEPLAGYPAGILGGEFLVFVGAAGGNAAERRESRCEIWRNRDSFEWPWRTCPARHVFGAKMSYSGEKALSRGFRLVRQIRGCPEVKAVRMNGNSVEWSTCADNSSTYVSVEIHPSGKGKEEYELAVEFC